MKDGLPYLPWHDRLGYSARAALGLLALVANGCLIGPQYKDPNPIVQERFSDLNASTHQVTEKQSPSPALPQWWEGFDDGLLNYLVTLCRSGNRNLLISVSRVEQARAIAMNARAQLFPEFSTSAFYLSQRLSSARFGQPGREAISFELWNVTAAVDWELDLFGRLRQADTAAQAELVASQFDLEDGLRLLDAETATSYLDLRGAQRRKLITQESILTQEKTLELVTARYNAGASSELDVSLAQSDLSATQAILPLYQSAEKSAMHRLAVLAGESPTALEIELGKERPLPRFSRELVLAEPSSLLRSRPDIRAAESRIRAATARVGATEALFFPQVTVTGQVSREASKPRQLSDGNSGVFSVQPAISWTPLDTGRIRSQLYLAEAENEQIVLQYESTVLAALEETENAILAFNTQTARRETLQSSVDSSARAHELAKLQYENGATDLLTVLDAERRLLARRLELIGAEIELDQAIINIVKAFGGGRAAD